MTESEWLVCEDPKPMLDACFALTTLNALGFTRSGQIGQISYRPSDRQIRLFACACCRDVWDLLPEQRSRRAVEVSERYVDGEATEEELQVADDGAADVFLRIEGYPTPQYMAAWVADERLITHLPSDWYSTTSGTPDYVLFPREMRQRQANLLRDIIGNPYQSVALPLDIACNNCNGLGYFVRNNGDTFNCKACSGKGKYCSWLNSIVSSIANRIYTSRDFTGMPILGDALEDAGCDNQYVLKHCHNLECVLATSGQIKVGSTEVEIPLRGQHTLGCWVIDLILERDKHATTPSNR